MEQYLYFPYISSWVEQGQFYLNIHVSTGNINCSFEEASRSGQLLKFYVYCVVCLDLLIFMIQTRQMCIVYCSCVK